MTLEEMYRFCIPNEFDGQIWQWQMAYGVLIKHAVSLGMSRYEITCFLFGKMRNIRCFREGSVDEFSKFYDFILTKLDEEEAEVEQRNSNYCIIQEDEDFVI